jgi:signal transduction histidine kinase
MKTNFLANVSHELRTPLNSIRTFSELLLTYDDPVVQKEFLEIIKSESERLTRLVNDVLDIVKIESGHFDWRFVDCDLTRLLEDAARTYGPIAEQRGLRLVFEAPTGPQVVSGDSDRLQQVLGNLLSNAVKFTTAGTITLGATQSDGEIRVFVADTGIGIAVEDQERIFDKFQQVGDTLTDKPHGTGLGLAICKDIVARHEGRLWVESRLGHGSTFVFAMPVCQASAESSAACERVAIAA